MSLRVPCACLVVVLSCIALASAQNCNLSPGQGFLPFNGNASLEVERDEYALANRLQHKLLGVNDASVCQSPVAYQFQDGVCGDVLPAFADNRFRIFDPDNVGVDAQLAQREALVDSILDSMDHTFVPEQDDTETNCRQLFRRLLCLRMLPTCVDCTAGADTYSFQIPVCDKICNLMSECFGTPSALARFLLCAPLKNGADFIGTEVTSRFQDPYVSTVDDDPQSLSPDERFNDGQTYPKLLQQTIGCYSAASFPAPASLMLLLLALAVVVLSV